MNDQFDKSYKSMSSKLHLLKKLRLTYEAAKMVYNTMVFNSLPLEMRAVRDFPTFRKRVKSFSW